MRFAKFMQVYHKFALACNAAEPRFAAAKLYHRAQNCTVHSVRESQSAEDTATDARSKPELALQRHRRPRRMLRYFWHLYHFVRAAGLPGQGRSGSGGRSAPPGSLPGMPPRGPPGVKGPRPPPGPPPGNPPPGSGGPRPPPRPPEGPPPPGADIKGPSGARGTSL